MTTFSAIWKMERGAEKTVIVHTKCLVSTKHRADNCSTNFKLNSTMPRTLQGSVSPSPHSPDSPLLRCDMSVCPRKRTITNNFSAFKHSSGKLINDISAKAHFNKYCQSVHSRFSECVSVCEFNCCHCCFYRCCCCLNCCCWCANIFQTVTK